MNNIIIYGDIHGSYDELVALRKKLNLNKDDIEICVGDIITKGKYSIKVIDYVIKNNIKSVLGNHEDKLIRYLKHQKSDKKNPIILNDDEQNIMDNLTPKHIQFLENLPLYLQFENITIVHGGMINNTDLENLSPRDKQQILRLRYLDKNGKFLAYGKEDETSIFWADIYDGKNGFVVYGHTKLQNVKINKYSLGIDTGCIYGNKLTAVVFNDKNGNYDIVQENYTLNNNKKYH